MRTNKYLTTVALAAFAMSLTACAANDGSSSAAHTDCVPTHPDLKTISQGKLTIGVIDAPPLVSTTGPDGYSGLDALIINGFAETECLSITPVAGAVAAMMTGVEQGRWDTALGGWYRTEERAKVVDLSEPMYLDTLVIISRDEIDSIKDLEGKKVGVHDGTVFVEDLKAVFGDSLTLYPSPLEAAQDLKAGRIDAAFGTGLEAPASYDPADFSILTATVDDRVETTKTPGQTSLPFNKESSLLREAFNEYLTVIRHDGRLAAFLEEYGFDANIADTGEPRYL